MKNIKLIGLITMLLWANSCTDFADLQVDPNRATTTHPSLLLTYLELNTFNYNDVGATLASRMLVYTDGAADEQYYGWQRASYFRYNFLRQVPKMAEAVDMLKPLNLDNYKALGLFFQSVQILEITRFFGDVPYSESMAGGSYTPVYDAQQDIYIKVLDDLKAAGQGLTADGGAISGDVIYDGDIEKWKKLINSYSLKVLMGLSNHTGNAALNVEGRFSEIVGDPVKFPIMTSNDDTGALHYVDQVNNRYPYFNSNGFKTAYYMDESFINLLKDLNDPRLFVLADKTPDAVDAELADDDPDAYGGLDGSAPLADNTPRVVAGEVSRVAKRYYSDPVNEPTPLLSYAEVEFTLAEAAARTWIADDPETHYLNGIHAALDFYGISSADQDDYVAGANVVYSPANGIEMIITQKYLTYFLNGGWEAFFNHQRTGFPDFKVSGGGVLNGGNIPKRWMYPQEEFTLNLDNIQAAISRQYPGGDNINAEMWLLKSE